MPLISGVASAAIESRKESKRSPRRRTQTTVLEDFSIESKKSLSPGAFFLNKFTLPLLQEEKLLLLQKCVFVRAGMYTRHVVLGTLFDDREVSLETFLRRTLHAYGCSPEECEEGLKTFQIRSAFKVTMTQGHTIHPRDLRTTDLKEVCVVQVTSRPLRKMLIQNAQEEKFAVAAFEEDIEFTKDTLGNRMHLCLNYPRSSLVATVWESMNFFFIILSTIAYVSETAWNYSGEDKFWNTFMIVEVTCVAVFTMDYVLRFAVDKRKLTFPFRLLNIVDIAAILPCYIELILARQGLAKFAMLRMIRLVRVFRLLKTSPRSLNILSATIVASLRPLYMLAFFSIIAIVLCSSLIYFAERGTWDDKLGVWMRPMSHSCQYTCKGHSFGDSYTAGLHECVYYGQQSRGEFLNLGGDNPEKCFDIMEQSPFDSIFAGAYWTVTTITTVGYGDLIPISVFGKLVGMATMILGIFVIGLPITVVGSNFAEVYESQYDL